MKRDLDRKTVPFYALLRNGTDFMKIVCTIALSLCLAAPAAANDQLATRVKILAGFAGDLRVVTENCGVSIDSLVGMRIAEALTSVPNIDMGAVLALIDNEYEKSAHFTGAECYPEDGERIERLKRLYNSELDSLKQAVARGDYE